jgi:CheY-like chemotaxis protein
MSEARSHGGVDKRCRPRAASVSLAANGNSANSAVTELSNPSPISLSDSVARKVLDAISPLSAGSVISNASLSPSPSESNSPSPVFSTHKIRSAPCKKRSLKLKHSSLTQSAELKTVNLSDTTNSDLSLRHRVLKQSHFSSLAKNLLVLVVDDSVVNSKVAANMLRIVGVNSEKVQSGREALERLQDRTKPRVTHVLTDIQMPEMDGMELAERITKLYIQPLPVIIGFTASPSQELRDQGLAAGITDFISKPMELSELTEVLGIQEQNNKFSSTSPASAPFSSFGNPSIQSPKTRFASGLRALGNTFLGCPSTASTAPNSPSNSRDIGPMIHEKITPLH